MLSLLSTRAIVQRIKLALLKRRIEPILRRPGPPLVIEDEATFDRLQARFPRRISYGYDPASLLRRGRWRANDLAARLKLTPGDRVCEIGAGDGMTAKILTDMGVVVTLVDLQDWRDQRAAGLPFVLADASTAIALDDHSFDAVYSYNTFEHLPDPAAALAEMKRLVKPGGDIRLSFGPIFPGLWGLHAYKTLTVPYAQWLFPEVLIQRKLEQLGISDLGEENREDLQPLNRWRLEQFRELFDRSGCEILDWETTTDSSALSIIEEFPDPFAGRGLTFDDLIVKAIRITMRKQTSLSACQP